MNFPVVFSEAGSGFLEYADLARLSQTSRGWHRAVNTLWEDCLRADWPYAYTANAQALEVFKTSGQIANWGKLYQDLVHNNPLSLQKSAELPAGELITCIAIAKDQSILYCGRLDGRIFLWDLVNSGLIHTFWAHPSEVTDIALGGAHFYSCSTTCGEIKMWDSQDLSSILFPPEQTGSPTRLIITDHCLVSTHAQQANDLGNIRFWGVENSQFSLDYVRIPSKSGQARKVTVVDVAINERWVCASVLSGKVYVWNRDSGAMMTCNKRGGRKFNGKPDLLLIGDRLYRGSGHALHTWDLTSPVEEQRTFKGAVKIVHTFRQPCQPVALLLSIQPRIVHVGDVLVAGGAGNLHFWNRFTSKHVTHVNGDGTSREHLWGDGDQLISVRDNRVYQWRLHARLSPQSYTLPSSNGQSRLIAGVLGVTAVMLAHSGLFNT